MSVGVWAISLTGIVIVFLGLGVLYIVMLVQTKIFHRENVEKTTPKIKRLEPVIPTRSEVEVAESIENLECAAVIAAVVAYMEIQGLKKESIKIKSIKRLKREKNDWKTKKAVVYWNTWNKEKRLRGVKRKW